MIDVSTTATKDLLAAEHELSSVRINYLLADEGLRSYDRGLLGGRA